MTNTQSLGDAMEQRRIERRMKWREVAEAAGLSLAGLGAIRRGERKPSEVTKARIEDALHWTNGSVDIVLAGGDPIPLLDPQQAVISDSEAAVWLDRASRIQQAIAARKLLAQALASDDLREIHRLLGEAIGLMSSVIDPEQNHGGEGRPAAS